MSIKTWIIITISSLLIAVVLVLSLSFYNQFQDALDERVMLQLTSIKRLKRVQIENFLNREWDKFVESDNDEKSIELTNSMTNALMSEKYQKVGIYDLTHLNPNGHLLIALIDQSKNKIKTIDHKNIQRILLERTGMGESGETYLVGPDFHLRSQSRFLPNSEPYSIEAKTTGVLKGLSGKNGHGIFPDYRGIRVYSAYHDLKVSNLNWVILSEMDSTEVMIPMQIMRERLFIIASMTVFAAILISLFLTRIFSRPIVKMQSNLKAMATGNYRYKVKKKNYPSEINEMFNALSELQNSLSGAVDFSVDIGKMNLQKTYNPKSPKDLLGHSLIKMRDKLIEYQAKGLQNTLTIKKQLIDRQETERKRLSMELHDGIGPLLTSLKLYVQTNITDSTDKKEIKKLIDETISEIRLITYSLMPPTLIDFGIGRTLENFVLRVKQTAPLNIYFEDLTHHEKSSISTNLGINIFRICQELVNNTIKHAEANKIVITLSEFDDHISLYYFDNGKGYDQGQEVSGAGLANIKERVDIFNGLLNIHSEKNNTTVEIELPITDGSN